MKNTLHRWMDDKGVSYADMAKTLGMKRGSLYRITNCEHWPRPELLALIQTHTGGDVTATQLVADWVAATSQSVVLMALVRESITNLPSGPLRTFHAARMTETAA